MHILDFKLLYTLVYKTHFLSFNFSLDIGVRLTHAIGIVQVYYGFSVYTKPFPSSQDIAKDKCQIFTCFIWFHNSTGLATCFNVKVKNLHLSIK